MGQHVSLLQVGRSMVPQLCPPNVQRCKSQTEKNESRGHVKPQQVWT